MKQINLFALILLCNFTTSTFGQKSKKMDIIAYYTGDDKLINEYEVGKLNQIIFSFCHLKEGKLSVDSAKDSTTIKHLVSLKASNPQLKIILSLGGWGGCEPCSAAFSTAEGRLTFAKSVKKVSHYFKVDGLDLDWEYPAIEGLPGHLYQAADKPNFTELVKILRSTLGKKYGKIARKSIVQVTLVSGFTTTVVWPLLSFLLNHYGWRNACFVYAGILIVWVFPVHKLLIPEKVQMVEEENSSLTIQEAVPTGLENTSVFTILLANFTIGSILMTGISVHLVEILNDNGLPLTMAISVGAMLGPSQVGIRFLDAILPKKTPLNSALVSSVTIFVGLVLFLMSQQIAFLAVICFGLGNGMRSILRGTLPLWIFGADSYATIMGRLAGLPMVAQALTPLLSGYMIAHFSVKKFVGLLVVLAFVNIITMVVLRNKILNKSRLLSA